LIERRAFDSRPTFPDGCAVLFELSLIVGNRSYTLDERISAAPICTIWA
jgi:hypothetical protein